MLTRTVLALASLVVLSACGGEEPTRTTPTRDTAETGRVTFETHDLSFVIPAGWSDIDVSEALESGDEGIWEELATKADMSVEQFKQYANSVEWISYTNKPSPKFADNVNLLAIPAASLGSDEELSSGFEAFGATVHGVERSSTDAGEAALISYTLPVRDLEAHGVAMVIDVGDESVVVTFSCEAADVCEERANAALTSVEAA